MKKTLLAFLVSAVCLASGKLEVSPSYVFDKKEVLPTLGVSIYEPIGLGLNYDSYTGGGVAPRVYSPDVHWFATRQDLETSFGNLTVGAGVTVRLMFQDGLKMENENGAHLTVSYKLW